MNKWKKLKNQALGTRTTIGKALYWSSSFKMQHRIKGYMLVHVTHNKVSRIFFSFFFFSFFLFKRLVVLRRAC